MSKEKRQIEKTDLIPSDVYSKVENKLEKTC